MAVEDMQLALELIKPIGLFIIGMVFYAVFVFKFYRFVAKKDILELDLERYNSTKHPFVHKVVAFAFWLVAYIVMMPIMVFFWFVILAILLAFLSRTQDVANILLVAMALVGAVRVTSYYSEDLSRDLAKMLPFALLGVYLVDITFFDFSTSVDVIKAMPGEFVTMLTYFVFVICLEFVLRLIELMVPRRVPKPEA